MGRSAGQGSLACPDMALGSIGGVSRGAPSCLPTQKWVDLDGTGRCSVGNEQRLRSLLEVGRALASNFDVEAVLERVLAAARELTGARYAAAGVLDEHDRNAVLWPSTRGFATMLKQRVWLARSREGGTTR